MCVLLYVQELHISTNTVGFVCAEGSPKGYFKQNTVQCIYRSDG